MAPSIDTFVDVEVSVKPKKHISHVMTVVQACRCHKSSKNHKMKPRQPKNDATKTLESKKKTMAIKRSHWHGDE